MNGADDFEPVAPAERRERSLRLRALAFARKLAPALATIVIGALLLFTIYFTELDWQWIFFLSGILFAALIALASRASQAEWIIRRRTLQLARLKDRLAQETSAHKHAESAYHASDDKLQLLSDAIPAMLVYTDAGAHVRSLNNAFRIWLGKRNAPVDGQALGDVLGAELYERIEQDVIKALEGGLNTFERKRTIELEIGTRLQVNYVPQADALGKTVGLFILMTEAREEIPWPKTVAPAAVETGFSPPPQPASVGNLKSPLTAADGGGQTLYLRSITEQLTGWDNPEQRLQQALQNDEFRLFCQQFRDLRMPGGDCPYYEILIRLQEEETNLTPPGAFIPVAEQFNMTTDLDRWVVRNVIGWHRRKRRGSPLWQNAMYSLNLFTASMFDPGFTDYVHRSLEESGVPPQVLCFELAEDEAVRNTEVAVRFANELHRLGCRVALGGFGSGRVSFDILKHLRVHFLKIDGGIVRDIQDNAVNRAKIEAISRVCAVIGVRSVAQFVESADVLQILTDCGVDFAQGFGVARPHSIDLLS